MLFEILMEQFLVLFCTIRMNAYVLWMTLFYSVICFHKSNFSKLNDKYALDANILSWSHQSKHESDDNYFNLLNWKQHSSFLLRKFSLVSLDIYAWLIWDFSQYIYLIAFLYSHLYLLKKTLVFSNPMFHQE